MAHCIVKFHLAILSLVNFILGALGRFYPRAIFEVNTVSGDVTDVVTLPVVADLDDFAETVNPECFLAIKMSSVTKVTHLKLFHWFVCPCCILDYQVLEFSLCLFFFYIDCIIKCKGSMILLFVHGRVRLESIRHLSGLG